MKPNPCPNLNHRRTDAPVRNCPNCGEIVNGNVSIQMCTAEQHAQDRMRMSKFCVNCGEQLIK